MARPILLAVDDDTSVLEAVVQDLRRQYGAEYRVMRAASGQAALDTLEQLKARQEPVALLLSDQRMPGMTGVDFLERARALYPEARRVLLTAYADTEAAIRAINTARIHYYLNKPWDPPEDKLYPVLSDLLDDWKGGYQPPFEGLRVLGNRWSLKDHRLRNFLSRNHVPYRWLDVAANEDAQKLLEEYVDGCRSGHPGRPGGTEHPCGAGVLRHGCGGRRSGRTGGSSLWSQRRSTDTGRRAGSTGRTGGLDLAD
jgi:thioredoxin reductase (NADPH)